jgi:hypothetical protein
LTKQAQEISHNTEEPELDGAPTRLSQTKAVADALHGLNTNRDEFIQRNIHLLAKLNPTTRLTIFCLQVRPMPVILRNIK